MLWRYLSSPQQLLAVSVVITIDVAIVVGAAVVVAVVVVAVAVVAVIVAVVVAVVVAVTDVAVAVVVVDFVGDTASGCVIAAALFVTVIHDRTKSSFAGDTASCSRCCCFVVLLFC